MKKEKEETNYTNVWMAFVDISAGDSYIFTELIDMEQKQIDNYIGAWC
jgi:hypothetical protein